MIKPKPKKRISKRKNPVVQSKQHLENLRLDLNEYVVDQMRIFERDPNSTIWSILQEVEINLRGKNVPSEQRYKDFKDLKRIFSNLEHIAKEYAP